MLSLRQTLLKVWWIVEPGPVTEYKRLSISLLFLIPSPHPLRSPMPPFTTPEGQHRMVAPGVGHQVLPGLHLQGVVG